MSATLGGLIKDFRIKKGIQQIDIAFSLGWKETSRLSRIEQGKSARPSCDLIENIARAMQLVLSEKNQLLLAGNYVPNDQESDYIKGKTKDFIESWPYPAHLLDFSWRDITHNEILLKTYSLSQNLTEFVNKKHPRILEILFHPDFPHNKKMKGEKQELWRQFLKNIILQFRYEQSNRSQEKWYIDHIKNMMENDLFRELWLESQNMRVQEVLVGKFAMKFILHPEDPDKLLKFYSFIVPVIEDLRFEIELMVPLDIETYQFYHKNNKQ